MFYSGGDVSGFFRRLRHGYPRRSWKGIETSSRQQGALDHSVLDDLRSLQIRMQEILLSIFWNDSQLRKVRSLAS